MKQLTQGQVSTHWRSALQNWPYLKDEQRTDMPRFYHQEKWVKCDNAGALSVALFYVLRAEREARSEFFSSLREKSQYARPNPTRPDPTRPDPTP